MKAFLAHHIGHEDRELVGSVETLLDSHDVGVIKGTRLGGEVLDPAIKERIESADALVALMTRRERTGKSGQWKTHPWVLKEFEHGRAVQKRTIGLVENNVRLPQNLAPFERIDLDRANPSAAVLALSETIRLWKEQLGNPRRFLIKPDTLGQQLLSGTGLACRYRLIRPDGKREKWQPADPIPQPGATVLYVDGVRSDDYHIEVQVMEKRKVKWQSLVTPQLISVELNRV